MVHSAVLYGPMLLGRMKARHELGFASKRKGNESYGNKGIDYAPSFRT
jgi:hypothetical protein